MMAIGTETNPISGRSPADRATFPGFGLIDEPDGLTFSGSHV